MCQVPRCDHGAASQTNFWQTLMSSESHERVQLCQDSQTQFALLRERVQVSAESITSSRWMATPFSLGKRRPKPLTKLDRGHSKRSFQDSQRVVPSKPRSAQTSQEFGARDHFDVAGPALLRPGRGFAAWSRHATTAGLLPEPLFVARLDIVIEATSTAFIGHLRFQRDTYCAPCKKQPKQQLCKATMANRSRTQRLQK